MITLLLAVRPTGEPAAQAAAGQFLHHQQAQAVTFHVVVDTDDMRMVESGEQPCLHQEPLADVLDPAGVLVQHLDGDVAVDQFMPAGEHHTEAPAAELVTDVVVR